MLGREVHEAFALRPEHAAFQINHRTRLRAYHVREGAIEFLRTSRLDEVKLHPQRPSGDLCSLCPVLFRAFFKGSWLPEDGDSSDPGHELGKQFQTLADQVRGDDGQPRSITARLPETCNKPADDWIANANEHDGKAAGRSLGRQGSRRAYGHDDIYLQRSQFICKR